MNTALVVSIVIALISLYLLEAIVFNIFIIALILLLGRKKK